MSTINTISVITSYTISLTNLTPGATTYVITGLADEDVWTSEPDGNIMDIVVGANGNSMVTTNSQGNKVVVKVRLIENSQDDQYYNTLFQKSKKVTQNQWDGSFNPVCNAVLTKYISSNGGLSTVTKTYINGVLTTEPTEVESVSGNVQALVHEWTLMFSNVTTSYN